MVHIMSERLQAVIAVIQGLQDKSNNLNFRRIFGYMKPHWRGDSGGYLCSHVRCDIILSIRWKLKSNSSPFWKTAVRLDSPHLFLFYSLQWAVHCSRHSEPWIIQDGSDQDRGLWTLRCAFLPLLSYPLPSSPIVLFFVAIRSLTLIIFLQSCPLLRPRADHPVVTFRYLWLRGFSWPLPATLLFLLSLDISTWTAIIHFLPLHPFILFTSVPPCLPLELKGAATQAAWNLK